MKVQLMVKKTLDCWGGESFFAYDECGQVEEDFASVIEAVHTILPKEQSLIQDLLLCEDAMPIAQFRLCEDGDWSIKFEGEQGPIFHVFTVGVQACTESSVILFENLKSAINSMEGGFTL